MKKVITSPKPKVSEDTARDIATRVAQSLEFKIARAETRFRSKQLVFFLPDGLEPVTVRRFTQALREEKETFSSVSAAHEA